MHGRIISSYRSRHRHIFQKYSIFRASDCVNNCFIMNSIYILKTVVLLCLAVCVPATAREFGEGEARALAARIISESGVEGGLVVHAGCGDGSLTAELGEQGPWLVHGLERDRKLVARAREHIQSLGRYGRVSVESWPGGKLPYADNLVNLVYTREPEGLGDYVRW